MSEFVIISGSPSQHSRSELVLDFIGTLLKKEDFLVTKVSIKDIPQDVLFEGKFDSPVITKITNLILNAKGVIVGSPVYKASYSGVLKALLDLLPQDVLQQTPVLPVMTGGSKGHLLAMEYTLKPLLASLKGQNLKGVYLQDSQIDKTNSKQPLIQEECVQRLSKQLYYLIETVNRQKEIIL